MQKLFLLFASLSGAFGVILGAMGSHWLKEKVNYWELNSFETGVRYQFIHLFALLTVALLMEKFDSKVLIYSGWMFIVGTLLFSGSLYGLSIKSIVTINYASVLGPITPIGGLILIIGWIMLFFSILVGYKTV